MCDLIHQYTVLENSYDSISSVSDTLREAHSVDGYGRSHSASKIKSAAIHGNMHPFRTPATVLPNQEPIRSTWPYNVFLYGPELFLSNSAHSFHVYRLFFIILLSIIIEGLGKNIRKSSMSFIIIFYFLINSKKL
jgi:hypothetical protein